jgi:hypothetical protein
MNLKIICHNKYFLCVYINFKKSYNHISHKILFYISLSNDQNQVSIAARSLNRKKKTYLIYHQGTSRNSLFI